MTTVAATTLRPCAVHPHAASMPLPASHPAGRARRLATALALLLGTLALPALAADEPDAEAQEADQPAASQSAPTTSAASAASTALTISEDGTLVIDPRARLAWPRCVEGMHWSGHSCTGAPQLFTYGEAQALARRRWQDSEVRWRLPRVNELRRLINRNAQPRVVDAALFPNAPPEWHWTGTASINTAAVNPYAYGNVMRGGEGESQLTVQQAWAVDMASGEARGDMARGSRLVLRLVRPAP